MPKRQIPDRLFLCALVFLNIAFAYGYPESQQFYLVHKIGGLSHACMTVLGAFTALALADVVVNDILPERYRIGISLYCRQHIWMFIASTLAGLAFVAIRYGMNTWLAVWYSLFAARCVGVAFLDLRYHSLKAC